MRIKCRGFKPSYANEFAAGLDIKSNTNAILYPGDVVSIETKLAVEIPSGYFGMVVIRSGLSFKYGINLINRVGIIDEDYRGEIGIKLINEGNKPYEIEVGHRVAQMILIPYKQADLEYVDELEETERNIKGFGSSGK